MLGGNLVPTLGRILEVYCGKRLRQVAVEILGDQGQAATDWLPQLLRMLVAWGDAGLRSAILEVLVRIGQPDDVILPLWIGLEDPDLRVRSSAMAALSSLGPLAGDAIHGIAAVARNNHEEPALRLDALRFLLSNKPDAEAIVGQPLPPLLESLEARNATTVQPPCDARVG